MALHQNGNQHDFSQFIDKKIDQATEEQIKQFCGAEEVRVVKDNEPMTMDLREERVNIIVDDEGKILAINMG